MNNRQTRAPSRVHGAPSARAPLSHVVPTPPHQHIQQAQPLPQALYSAAPNAALLIDFDNVTMGIRSELATELKSLLTSDVVKGKIAIRRAYADWRRYPQYVLPLTETSIDLIYAPAYGSARKNATDIRLAIDAMELVFTRPEIGTIVLLSGDSDFSSLVIKLKEYGKYIIGVGIRESSSDLLVQNCDEYYSYSALAGLVKAGDEPATRWDPWELVSEAVARMKRNGDVMRADRLKQVMQEIDNTFDEKDLNMAKFSRFVTEAAQRGLLHMTKLENGQLEVDLPRVTTEPAAAHATSAPAPGAAAAPSAPRAAAAPRADAPERGAGEAPAGADRGRRGMRPRRGGRSSQREASAPVATTAPIAASVPIASGNDGDQPAAATVRAEPAVPSSGERLTRSEAFDLLRKSVEQLVQAGMRIIPAQSLREKARELLGRDSDTLAERYFGRILQDAHDADVIDVRRRGDDYEIAPAIPTASLAEQLGGAPAAKAEPRSRTDAMPAAARKGTRSGRAGFGNRLGEAPPDLLSIGMVDSNIVAAPAPVAVGASAAAAQADGAPPAGDAVAIPATSTRTRTRRASPRARSAAAGDVAGEAEGARPRKGTRGARKGAVKAGGDSESP